MTYLAMVLITWIPIGITMSSKILYEMFNSCRFRIKRVRIMKPILRKAVKESLTSAINFKELMILQKMNEEDPKVVVANPREVKYKDTRSFN